MHISAFMTPLDKAVYCLPDHPIRTALDLMVTKKVGSVLVLNKEKKHRPIGIVTSTDMLEAYHKDLKLDENTVEEIMSKKINAVVDTMSKDEAAKVMEKSNTHHAVVVDRDGNCVGIVSTMDIALETARDARAWPWIRQDNGKFATPTTTPGSPRGPVEEQEGARKRSSFIQYIDNLQYLDI